MVVGDLIGSGASQEQAIVGETFLAPLDLSVIARSHAALGKFDEARRFIAQAMTTLETNKEEWFEVEVNRIAGEVELKAPERDTAKAEE